METTRDSGLAADELLHAQAELWSHVFAYTKSMSLRCAIELGIPDSLTPSPPPPPPPRRRRYSCRARRGSRAAELQGALPAPPHATAQARRHLPRGRWTEDAYELTAISRLLVDAPGPGQGLSPFARAMLQLHPIIVSPSMSLPSWFRAADDGADAPCAAVHGGRELWAVAKDDPEFGAAFNDAMACDGRFVMDVLLRGHGGALFREITSLMDLGGAAKAIAAAFPHVRCSVLELPHVVASVPPGDGGVEFVAGDMFEHVPKADAVLLKVTGAASAPPAPRLSRAGDATCAAP
uniref:O-methyltransferase C-terminal domain-containing protein n=1 Tax=Oryza brachyantha TaxID=4533 RepID=J3L458_ORYBR